MRITHTKRHFEIEAWVTRKWPIGIKNKQGFIDAFDALTNINVL